MRNTFSALVLASGIAAASPAFAEEDRYFGAAAGQFSVTESGEEAEPAFAFLRYGMEFNDYLAAEFRAGMGLGDDSVNIDGIAVETELKQLLGAYLKVGYPVTESIYPYVLFGASHTKFNASVAQRLGRVTASEKRDSVSYGLGVAFEVSDLLAITVEQTRYTDKDELEMDGLSIGFSRNF
ncbi:porin family protein [Spongiibacter marinus]|uniref:porin family protein n=1 Tax=Spongiibacter marinus TaxID=354246 RepID=UPI003C38285E